MRFGFDLWSSAWFVVDGDMANRLILILIVALLLASCHRKGRIDLITSSTPLTFKIEGRGNVQWIWIQGPYQNQSEPGPELKADSDPTRIILWKIRPRAQEGIIYDVPVNRIPNISYGRYQQDGIKNCRKRVRLQRSLTDTSTISVLCLGEDLVQSCAYF